MKMRLAVAVLALMGGTAMAENEWGDLAVVSDTLGMNAGRLCTAEETRGDIGCPTYAPYVSATTGYIGIGTDTPSVTLTVSGTTFASGLSLKTITGGAAPVSNTVSGGGGGATALDGLSDVTLSGSTTGDLLYYNGTAWINQASSGLFLADRLTSGTHVITVNTASGYVSLSTSGTDWGYLGSAASYLPTLTANLVSSTQVSATNISATVLTVNGVEITGVGVSALASLTDISATGPADNSLLRYNSATSTWDAVGINEAVSTTTMVSGWPDAILCQSGFFNLVLNISYQQTPAGTVAYRYINSPVSANDVAIVFNSDGTYNSDQTMSAYDCVTNTWSITELYAEGRAFNFIGNNGTGSEALGDRITSGTTLVTANTDGYISLTTGGTTTGYFDTAGRLVAPGISLTSMHGISSTNAHFSGNVGVATTAPVATLDVSGTVRVAGTGDEVCSPSTWGTFRRNPSTGRMQICRSLDE